MKTLALLLSSFVSTAIFAQHSNDSKLIVAQESNLTMADDMEEEELIAPAATSSKHVKDLRKDYYYHLIVATFDKRKDAHDYRNQLRHRGFEAEIIENSETSFYVHIPCYKTKNIDYDMLTMVRQDFSDAWYKWLDSNKLRGI